MQIKKYTLFYLHGSRWVSEWTNSFLWWSVGYERGQELPGLRPTSSTSSWHQVSRQAWSCTAELSCTGSVVTWAKNMQLSIAHFSGVKNSRFFSEFKGMQNQVLLLSIRDSRDVIAAKYVRNYLIINNIFTVTRRVGRSSTPFTTLSSHCPPLDSVTMWHSRVIRHCM